MTISNEAVEDAADGPLYYAKGREVWKRPVKTRTQNGHSVALGFRVCSCGDEIGEGGAATVAQLLSMAETFQTRTDSNEPMGCPLPGACACPAAPHMLPAPEGVSEAKRDVADLIGRIIAARDDFKNRDMFGARYLADVLADAANALSSERERAERAEAERDDAIARWCIRMADVREASGVGVKPMLDEVPGAIKARIAAIEARAQAAEAKVEELEAPFDWTAEDLVDLMAEAIMDAIDLDTSATDYARAALIALNKEGLLRPSDYREPDQ